jgi:DNA-binding NtrC family response regulator
MIEEQERSGVTGWDPKALELLLAYDWPGNVRELRNIVHRAYVMTEGKTIRPDVLQTLLPKAARAASSRKPPLKQKASGTAARKK